MVRPGLRWLAAFVTFSASIPNATALQVPVGPERPRTTQECVDAFAPVFQQHYLSNSCRHCDDIEGFPGSRWSARYIACYKQCGAARRSEHAAIMAARSACFGRAKQFADDEERARIQKLEGMKLGERLLRAYNQTRNIMDDLQSPERFFKRAVEGMSTQVRSSLMDQHRRDPITVEAQVHAYTFTQARAGIEAASELRGKSDLIAGIQKNSLGHLERVHSRILMDFEAAMAKATALETSSYGAPSYRGTPIRSYSPQPLHRNLSNGDCSVLDTKAASDMADDEPERFEALSARCRRGGKITR